MRRFEEGDTVRVDIPDKTDPDHDEIHGKQGTVVGLIEDDAGRETGDPRDSHLFEVRFEDHRVAHLRWRDLRPVL
jgi:ribosomal protein L21E